LAKKVLFEGEKVQLTTVQKIDKTKAETKERKSKNSNQFFIWNFKKLRSEIAKEEEVPAYVIFNDATLRQLENQRPMSDSDF